MTPFIRPRSGRTPGPVRLRPCKPPRKAQPRCGSAMPLPAVQSAKFDPINPPLLTVAAHPEVYPPPAAPKATRGSPYPRQMPDPNGSPGTVCPTSIRPLFRFRLVSPRSRLLPSATKALFASERLVRSPVVNPAAPSFAGPATALTGRTSLPQSTPQRSTLLSFGSLPITPRSQLG